MENNQNQTTNDKTQTQENVILTFLKKFISFEYLITPSIIKVIFWIQTSLILICGVIKFVVSLFTFNILGIIFIPVLIAFLIAIIKVACELIIVVFQNNKYLKQIAENTKK